MPLVKKYKFDGSKYQPITVRESSGSESDNSSSGSEVSESGSDNSDEGGSRKRNRERSGKSNNQNNQQLLSVLTTLLGKESGSEGAGCMGREQRAGTSASCGESSDKKKEKDNDDEEQGEMDLDECEVNFIGAFADYVRAIVKENK